MTEPSSHAGLPSPSMRPSRRPFWLALLVGGLTLAVFSPVLHHAFLFWDDNIFILRNADLTSPKPDGLAKFWGHPLEGYKQFYVPVTYTVWWTVAHFAAMAGTDGPTLSPRAFHALNLSFHTFNAMLVFLILRRLVKSDWPAAAGALLFALHPLQADPVSWAANMYTSLSALLSFLALLSYLNYSDARFGESAIERGGAGQARLWLAAATLCYALALLAKPAIILLPLAVAAIEALLRERRIRDCVPLAGWMVLAAIDAVLTHRVQTGAAAYQPPYWARPLVAGDALAFYLYKLVLPFDLIPDYGRSPRWAVHHLAVWFTWAAPSALFGACFALRRRAAWPWCAAIVFVLGVFPMLGLVPFDFQKYSTVADRYLYFSLFGASLAAAFGVRRLATTFDSARAGAALRAGACGSLLVLAVLCRAQVGYWTDGATLFGHTLEVYPESLCAHAVMGCMLLDEGGAPRLAAAVEHFRAAAQVDPEDAGFVYDAGVAYARQGELAPAAACFRQASRLKTDEPRIPLMLGRTLEQIGDRRAAIDAYADIARRFPNFADTDFRLGRLLAQSGDVAGAMIHYRAYLRVHPESTEARLALGRLQPAGPAEAATDLR